MTPFKETARELFDEHVLGLINPDGTVSDYEPADIISSIEQALTAAHDAGVEKAATFADVRYGLEDSDIRYLKLGKAKP